MLICVHPCNPWLILFIISSNTSSMLFPVESITIASSATFKGESARVESRRSRSIMSESVSANVADEIRSHSDLPCNDVPLVLQARP